MSRAVPRAMRMRGLASFVLSTALLAACKAGGDAPTPRPATPLDAVRAEVLASLSSAVLLPSYEAFAAEATVLKAATDAFAAAPADPAALSEAQQAWRSAMTRWQRAEVMQLGPTADTSKPGGQDLRHRIYSWPAINPCRVDQNLVEGRWDEPSYFDTQLVNAYGLVAMEYLLFHRGGGNACSSSTDINTGGGWAALGADELARRRAAYARAVGGRLVADARALVDAWSPSGGNFVAQLAGGEGSVYGSPREALDALFAALFYLDVTVKDAKLALPAGLSSGCSDAVCPDDAESRWAGFGKASIVANLQAGRALFLGNEPGAAARPGFDDLLAAVDAAPLAERIAAAFDSAIAAVEAIPGTLQDSIRQDPTPARDAHAAVKALTDLLKIDLVMTLSLKKPAEGGGDTD